MKSAGVLAAALWVVTIGCGKDPAREVKIISAPPPPASAPSTSTPTSAPPAPKPKRVARRVSPPDIAPDSGPVAAFCPPAAEDVGGPGNLVLTGPCRFQHRAEVKCESSPDDFIIGFVRKALNGASVAVYINVENYRGPGAYNGTQMFVAVQSGTAIYRWSNDNVQATVGPGEAFLELATARLDAEPMLIDCSRLIGPESNYQYQCAGRAAGSVTVDEKPEIVSGTLRCAQTK